MLAASSSGAVSSVAGRTGDIVLAVGDVSGAAPLASPQLTGAATLTGSFVLTPGTTSTIPLIFQAIQTGNQVMLRVNDTNNNLRIGIDTQGNVQALGGLFIGASPYVTALDNSGNARFNGTLTAGSNTPLSGVQCLVAPGSDTIKGVAVCRKSATTSANLIDVLKEDRTTSLFSVGPNGSVTISQTNQTFAMGAGGAINIGSNAARIYHTGGLVIDLPSGGQLNFSGRPTDGATAVSTILNCTDTLSNAGAKLVSFRNGSVEKSCVRQDGSFSLPALADSAAANNSLYFSSDTSKLTFKDSTGTLHAV